MSATPDQARAIADGLEQWRAHPHLDSAVAALRQLAKLVAELEPKANAYDSTHRNGWLDRAHAVARIAAEQDARHYGRDVWHIAVERAENLPAAEAQRDRLTAGRDKAMEACRRIDDILAEVRDGKRSPAGVWRAVWRIMQDEVWAALATDGGVTHPAKPITSAKHDGTVWSPEAPDA